jgi:serine/threonine protein kinase
LLKDILNRYEPLWGNWYVKELLGKGSTGEVYKISKVEYNKEYISALKIIKIPTKEQFQSYLSIRTSVDDKISENYFNDIIENIIQEIDLLYKLRGNSNIITYEDHMIKKENNENVWYIFIRMEFAQSLSDYIRSNKINEEDIRKLGIDICSALSVCHEKGILHRDIKEDNIFVSDGKFKLGDFSVSKSLKDNSYASTKVGTINYMPPEIFYGNSYTKNADIYSLGIILYKLLNKGRYPFMPPHPEQFTASDIEKAQIERLKAEKLNEPLTGGKKIKDIILKSCLKDINKRYQSVDEMKEDLKSISIDSKNIMENNLDRDSNINKSKTNLETNNETIDIFSSNEEHDIGKEKIIKNKPSKKLILIFSVSVLVISAIILSLFKFNNNKSNVTTENNQVGSIKNEQEGNIKSNNSDNEDNVEESNIDETDIETDNTSKPSDSKSSETTEINNANDSVTLENNPYLVYLNRNGFLKISNIDKNASLPVKYENNIDNKWSHIIPFNINKDVYISMYEGFSDESSQKFYTYKINEDGSLGSLLYDASWSKGYNLFETFDLSGKTYIFHFKNGKVDTEGTAVGTARFSSITSVKDSNGNEKLNYDLEFSETWESINKEAWTSFSAFSFNNNSYVIKNKSGGSGLYRILKLSLTDSKIKLTTVTPEKVYWDLGWDKLETFQLNNKVYLLQYNSSTGEVKISEFIKDSSNEILLDDPVWDGKWQSGFENIEAFKLDGESYLSLNRPSDGSTYIYKLDSAFWKNSSFGSVFYNETLDENPMWNLLTVTNNNMWN